MFGRGRRPATTTPTNPRGEVGARVHAEAVAVADPDYVTIERGRALRAIIGRGLQGGAGIVIDYDRGDPEHSFTRVVQPFHNPTTAANRIGMRDGVYLPQPESYDQGTTDEQLTAYEQATLARIAR